MPKPISLFSAGILFVGGILTWPIRATAANNKLPAAAIRAEANEIRAEATRPNFSKRGRPLPLACSWITREGWGPGAQLRLIQQGHFLLPSFAFPGHPNPRSYYSQAFINYYKRPLEQARQLKLPICLLNIGSWGPVGELATSPAYWRLPPRQNPDVVTAKGEVLHQVSPFGAIQPWRNVGRLWIRNAAMEKLQQWYPNPPRVIFLFDNEAPRLVWSQAPEDRRYLTRYGRRRDDYFKKQVAGDGWITRYRMLHKTMRNSLVAPAWKKHLVIIGYNAGNTAYWPYWLKFSMYIPGRVDIAPLMWDGGDVPYYLDASNPITYYTDLSPQIDFMNLALQLPAMYRLNPSFWYEISPWDGHNPAPQATAATDKLKYFARMGEPFTPVRYEGFVQFGMWLLRPRAVRYFAIPPSRAMEQSPYFMALVAAVDRIYHNRILRQWWRHGKLLVVHRRTAESGASREIRGNKHWFLLQATCNPKQPWTLSTTIPVMSLALTRGPVPDRQWLVYAEAPMGQRNSVRISIPSYRAISVNVPEGGAFYQLSEKTGGVRLVQETK